MLTQVLYFARQTSLLQTPYVSYIIATTDGRSIALTWYRKMCSHMITTWFQGSKIEFNLYRSGEIILRQHFSFWHLSKNKTNKQTRSWELWSVSLVFYIGLHVRIPLHLGMARAYLTVCAAHLLFFSVCDATNLFCADRVTCALLRHFHALKFIVSFFFCGGGGKG